jgi:L-malate glycosyltransferase
LPQPKWLKLLRSAADSNPSFAIFGGPIIPKWESPPEEWVMAWVPLGPTYALLNPLNEGPIHPRLVFGPNMALRTTIFEHGYRFDEAIGPNGCNYAMGSEAELLRRLAQDGFQAWHCRNAVAQHIIRSFQMSEEWVLARAVRYGRGQYRMQAKNLPKQPLSLLGIPVPLLARIATQSLRIVHAKWYSNPEWVFKERWQLKYLTGKAIEARLLSKEVGCPIMSQGGTWCKSRSKIRNI